MTSKFGNLDHCVSHKQLHKTRQLAIHAWHAVHINPQQHTTSYTIHWNHNVFSIGLWTGPCVPASLRCQKRLGQVLPPGISLSRSLILQRLPTAAYPCERTLLGYFLQSVHELLGWTRPAQQPDFYICGADCYLKALQQARVRSRSAETRE